MRSLDTDRLALEPLTRRHAAEMFEALADPALYRYIDEKQPVSLEALAARYGRLESRRSGDGREHWLNWVLREKASGKAVGFVQASVLEDGTAFVAYVVAPEHQRRGFGREATVAMMAELRASYAAREYRASVDARNEPSLRLLAGLGFTESHRDLGDIIFVREVEPDLR